MPKMAARRRPLTIENAYRKCPNNSKMQFKRKRCSMPKGQLRERKNPQTNKDVQRTVCERPTVKNAQVMMEMPSSQNQADVEVKRKVMGLGLAVNFSLDWYSP